VRPTLLSHKVRGAMMPGGLFSCAESGMSMIGFFAFGVSLIAIVGCLFVVARRSSSGDAKLAAWMALVFGIFVCLMGNTITFLPDR
jgi:hypothetical protein